MEPSECFSTYLLQNWSDVLQRQRRKLILLEEIVQVLFEHLKDQACVILVLKALERSHKVELVGILLTQSRQDRDFDLPLTRVRRMVLEDLDGDDVAGAFLPALHHLTEGSATEEFKNLKKEIKDLASRTFNARNMQSPGLRNWAELKGLKAQFYMPKLLHFFQPFPFEDFIGPKVY